MTSLDPGYPAVIIRPQCGGGDHDRGKPVPVSVGAPIPTLTGPAKATTVIESHPAGYSIRINGVWHVAAFVTRCVELVIVSTRCGCTADTARDDFDSPHITNCPQCIPFRRTR